MDDWDGFIAQVRELYLTGEINLDQFVRDIQIAALLEEGILPDNPAAVPAYLHDRNGFPIVAA